jgi:ABC-type phosphate/phosphonate transport system substrate-binding protein
VWSLSGWVSLLAVADELGPFADDPLITGSHRASAVAVRTGAAEIASLDAVCGALAAILGARRERPADLTAHWRGNDFLLSQTCGFPLGGYVPGEVVGTLVHAGVGTSPGRYRSVVVARAGSSGGTRPLRAAVNDVWSLSGWVSLLAVADELGPFADDPLITGSHRASVVAVRTGAAEIASLDAVTYALLARHARHELGGIEVVGEGPDVPELPLVTSRAALVEPLRESLAATMSSTELAPHLERLLVTGFIPRERGDYAEVAALAGRVLGELPAPP